jgi:hypothetical protein
MSRWLALAEWQDLARQGLPAESDFVARNAAITSRYAEWYRAEPQLFKWAGLAYFASHRIGFAMRELSLLIENDFAGRPAPRRRFQNLDLELIRITNNRVFDDIGWAHFAYVSADGGLAAIEHAAAAEPAMHRIVAAFRMLDNARRERDTSATALVKKTALIWRAAVLLTRHEQEEIVQPQFNQMSPQFALLLSVATSLDLDGSEWDIDADTFSSFYAFMWTLGIDVVFKTRKLPNVCRFDHRWCWVRRAVLTRWRAVDALPAELRDDAGE